MDDAEDHPKVFRYPILLSEHVFDKLRSIDLGLAEFEELLDGGVVIEKTALKTGMVKDLMLLIERARPLHLVVVVDDEREEENGKAAPPSCSAFPLRSARRAARSGSPWMSRNA